MFGDQGEQLSVTVDAGVDPPALQHLAEVVHHDDVVVILGPVNSARDSHMFLQSSTIPVRLRESAAT